jgi:hypothetical protein
VSSFQLQRSASKKPKSFDLGDTERRRGENANDVSVAQNHGVAVFGGLTRGAAARGLAANPPAG